MRLLALIIVAVSLLLLAFAFLPQNVKDAIIPPSESPYAKGVETFGDAHAKEFITFKDPEYAFRVSYPIGYLAVFPNTSEERFHVVAQVPDSSAMVFSVAVSNESAQSVYSADMEGLPFTVLSKGSTKINGKDALYVDGILSEEVSTERMYAKQVVIQCPAYALVATGAIPSFLTQERITFDYMFTTLECPA